MGGFLSLFLNLIYTKYFTDPRNSVKFVSYKNQKEFCADLKLVYHAPSEDAGQTELTKLIEKWSDKYPLAIKPWVNHWEHISTFFKFPHEVCRLIYTTNHVEALHRQFRKVTKSKAVFPTDDALLKMLFLSASNASKKWRFAVRDWLKVIAQLDIFFEGRVIMN